MKRFLLLLTFVFCSTFIFAESLIDEKFGYSMDLPEGYVLDSSSDDGLMFLFTHPSMHVNLILRIYENTDALTAQKIALGKLGAQYQTDSFMWGSKNCSVSTFTMTLDDNYEGLSFSSPLNNDEASLVAIAYVKQANYTKASQFMMSMLNSLSVDEETDNLPGILITYLFPSEGSEKITLDIGGKKISTAIDKSDVEANQFVVDMEFGCFSHYASHKLWKEAWQRYYKMVYKDSKARLKNVSKDIYKGLKIKNKTDYANTLLQWTQDFPYKRDNQKNSSSDFTPVMAVLKGEGNDCDSRSMLVSALLNIAGFDSIMIISREYSHAMVGLNLTAPGQTFSFNNKNYLYGETTAPVTFGKVAQNQMDFSKWIVVDVENTLEE